MTSFRCGEAQQVGRSAQKGIGTVDLVAGGPIVDETKLANKLVVFYTVEHKRHPRIM